MHKSVINRMVVMALSTFFFLMYTGIVSANGEKEETSPQYLLRELNDHWGSIVKERKSDKLSEMIEVHRHLVVHAYDVSQRMKQASDSARHYMESHGHYLDLENTVGLHSLMLKKLNEESPIVALCGER